MTRTSGVLGIAPEPARAGLVWKVVIPTPTSDNIAPRLPSGPATPDALAARVGHVDRMPCGGRSRRPSGGDWSPQPGRSSAVPMACVGPRCLPSWRWCVASCATLIPGGDAVDVSSRSNDTLSAGVFPPPTRSSVIHSRRPSIRPPCDPTTPLRPRCLWSLCLSAGSVSESRPVDWIPVPGVLIAGAGGVDDSTCRRETAHRPGSCVAISSCRGSSGRACGGARGRRGCRSRRSSRPGP
jgi:hypothetical protein